MARGSGNRTEAWRKAIGRSMAGRKQSLEHVIKQKVAMARTKKEKMDSRSFCKNGHPWTPENIYSFKENPQCIFCHKSQRLFRRIGITLEEKKRVYAEQRGLCAACGLPMPENMSKVAADHDHATGKFRAVIHHDCNTILGREEKAPGLFKKLLAYKARFGLPSK